MSQFAQPVQDAHGTNPTETRDSGVCYALSRLYLERLPFRILFEEYAATATDCERQVMDDT